MSRITATPSVSLGVASTRSGWLARAADYVELTKPRIVVLELVTVVVAAHLASPSTCRNLRSADISCRVVHGGGPPTHAK